MGSPEFVLLFCLVVVTALLVGFWMRLRAVGRYSEQAAQDRAEARAAQAECQERLSGGQAKLDALGEASLDALFLLDEERQIAWANAAAAEMFSAGKPVVAQSFIGAVRDFELNQAVLDAAAGHRPIVRQAAADGRSLRIRAVPVEETGHVAVAIEDATELQRLGRARRDFIANISHEVRTPLANIDLAAQTLRNSSMRDESLIRRMLDQIERQVQSLSQLAQEMMDLSQIESGQALLKLVPVAIGPLVRHSVTHLLPHAQLKGQHISLVLPEELMVLADEQQVSRVIANLVHNAIKFAPEGGIISIYAEAVDEEDVRVCVADNGPGIFKDEQERIFERGPWLGHRTPHR
jgi:two-component system phosphate regulon sensor histidine kinase PhoR